MDELDEKIAAVIYSERPPLSEKAIARLRKQFDEADENGDGYIDREELKNLVRGIGGDDEEYLLEMVMGMADADGDGNCDFEEFIQAAGAMPDVAHC